MKSQGVIEMVEENEYTAPSGDVYKFKLLTYGEKMDISELKATGTKIKAGGRSEKTPEVEVDISAVLKMQREIVYKTLIEAAWLELGKKPTKELIDNNIKGIDAEAINAFVEKINYPQGDVAGK